MLEERGEPPRIRKVIGQLTEAIPFLAVDKIDPWGNLAELCFAEDVAACAHCNDLNELDSLQSIAYTAVMSITALEHYSNGSRRPSFAVTPVVLW
jgi:hypothetical protein